MVNSNHVSKCITEQKIKSNKTHDQKKFQKKLVNQKLNDQKEKKASNGYNRNRIYCPKSPGPVGFTMEVLRRLGQS